ncbi:hypothetical protein [Rhodococcus sp. UNC23MFCrub1.1]|uniref:hypothetical protein n=1 Tax=Rhodococcus sp. UNC23MFCrub1.1 TaxID=1449068 RepID=UPI0004827903|nr:hypothetical protein [Rhodococcus sp. UNC23MFCrub1.1]
MRRLATAVVLLLALIGLGAGTASAQEPEPVAPITGIAEDGNAFQQQRRECLADTLDGNAFQNFMNQVTGEVVAEGACLIQSFEDNPGDAVATAASSAASAFWGDSVGDFAKAVMEGNAQAFRTVMTFWMTAGIPGLGAETAMSGLRNIVTGFTVAALFASLVIAMTKLAVARKQAVMEGATETASMLVRTVFTVALLPVLVLMFHQGGDAASAYALERFVGGDLNEKITAITAFDEKTGLGPVFALACAGFAFLGSVAQLIALLIREAVLCVVVAVIPLAAASSATATGRSSYKSMIAFTLGALLFKPVATLLYLFAFWAQSSSSGDPVASVIIGSVLLAVVGFALPTLVRIIAPAAETIAAGGVQAAGLAAAGGALAGGAGMLGAKALSTGARALGGTGGGSGPGPGMGAAGTGAKAPAGYRGQYTGGAPVLGKLHTASGAVGRAARGASGVAAATRGGTAATLGGAAGAVRTAASGARSAAQVAGGLGSAAGGAVGNYHGRIPR